MLSYVLSCLIFTKCYIYTKEWLLCSHTLVQNVPTLLCNISTYRKLPPPYGLRFRSRPEAASNPTSPDLPAGRPRDATPVRPLILLHAAAPRPPAGMGRYGPFPTAAGDGGGCLPLPIVAAEGALAVLDGAIATAAFVQVG